MYKELHDIQTERVDSLEIKVDCLEEEIAFLKHKNRKLKCRLESAKLCQKVYLQCRDEMYKRFYLTCKCETEVLKTSLSRHKKSKKCMEFHNNILE